MKRLIFWVTEMLIVFFMICASSFLIFSVLSMANKFLEAM